MIAAASKRDFSVSGSVIVGGVPSNTEFGVKWIELGLTFRIFVSKCSLVDILAIVFLIDMRKEKNRYNQHQLVFINTIKKIKNKRNTSIHAFIPLYTRISDVSVQSMRKKNHLSTFSLCLNVLR